MRTFFLAFSMLFSLSSMAQNGKLVNKEPFVFGDSVLAKLSKRTPDIRTMAGQVVISRITYLSDGLKVKGYLLVPEKAGEYPVIIFNRGGNREFGKIADNLIGLMTEIASWGYIVVASQYRGNDGGEGKEEFGGADVNDVLNLIPLVASVPKADTTRIGMMGWSRGGMETYIALTKTCKIRAAVVGSGLADAFMNARKRPDMEKDVFSQLIPDYQRTRDSALLKRSAVYWADNMCKTTPLLIMQGTSDWRVSPPESMSLVQKLYEYKHPVRFVLLEGGQHSLIEHWGEVMHNTRVFFDKYLRDREIWPPLEPHGE